MNVVYWSHTLLNLFFFYCLCILMYVYTDLVLSCFGMLLIVENSTTIYIFCIKSFLLFFGSVLILLHSSNYCKFLLIRKQCGYGSIIAPRWTHFEQRVGSGRIWNAYRVLMLYQVCFVFLTKLRCSKHGKSTAIL